MADKGASEARYVQRKPRAVGAPADMLPAHAEEAERGVLGCILLSPTDCLDDCHELGLTEEWFYDLRNQTVFHAMRRLNASSTPIDVVTLTQWLRDAGTLENVGGTAYIAELPNATGSSENLIYYVDIIREKFYARAATKAFTQGVMDLQAAERMPAQVLADVQKTLEGLAEMATTHQECQVKSILPNVIDRIESGYHRGSAQMDGLSTGLPYLDKILCGIGGDNGNMIVLSARPGVGKTSLAMQVVLHVALDHRWFTPQLDEKGVQLEADGKKLWNQFRGLPTWVFSLEMSEDALTKRLLFQRSKADMQRFRNGFAMAADFDKLAKGSAELAQAKIYIDATGRCTIDELKARARRAVRQCGVKLFVIDYIQLLRVSRRDRRNERREELEEISGEIFKLGKELGVPFIVLAQMNRDYEKDPNRVPRLSDLKDCGAIEQDADVILFLYGPKRDPDKEDELEAMLDRVYGNDWSVKPTRVDALVAKNRHGMSDAKCELLFQKSSTLFLDFVEWKKANGFQEAAKGEAKRRKNDDEEDEL